MLILHRNPPKSPLTKGDFQYPRGHVCPTNSLKGEEVFGKEPAIIHGRKFLSIQTASARKLSENAFFVIPAGIQKNS